MNQHKKELSIIQLLNSFFHILRTLIIIPLSSFFALKVVEWVKTLEGGIL